MYSTHKGKSVVAKRFIKALKYKIYKYMALILRHVYIDNLLINTNIHIIAQSKWSMLM